MLYSGTCYCDTWPPYTHCKCTQSLLTVAMRTKLQRSYYSPKTTNFSPSEGLFKWTKPPDSPCHHTRMKEFCCVDLHYRCLLSQRVLIHLLCPTVSMFIESFYWVWSAYLIWSMFSKVNIATDIHTHTHSPYNINQFFLLLLCVMMSHRACMLEVFILCLITEAQLIPIEDVASSLITEALIRESVDTRHNPSSTFLPKSGVGETFISLIGWRQCLFSARL